MCHCFDCNAVPQMHSSRDTWIHYNHQHRSETSMKNQMSVYARHIYVCDRDHGMAMSQALSHGVRQLRCTVPHCNTPPSSTFCSSLTYAICYSPQHSGLGVRDACLAGTYLTCTCTSHAAPRCAQPLHNSRIHFCRAHFISLPANQQQARGGNSRCAAEFAPQLSRFDCLLLHSSSSGLTMLVNLFDLDV